ncbi:hypothetical protein SARC_14899, partial [Sphaeroforma arctica JP610]
MISFSELELMRSRLGGQINKPPPTELLKTSELPKMPKDSNFRMENCEDIIQFATATFRERKPSAQTPEQLQHNILS